MTPPAEEHGNSSDEEAGVEGKQRSKNFLSSALHLKFLLKLK